MKSENVNEVSTLLNHKELHNISYENYSHQEKNKDISTKNKSIKTFQFATWKDIILLLAGLILGACSGAMQPFNYLFFADVTGAIIKFDAFMKSNNSDPNFNEALEAAKEQMMEDVLNFVRNRLIVGFATFAAIYLSTYLICRTGTNQISRIRSSYIKSILNKDISWFDLNQSGEFSGRIVEDLNKIEDAIGDKLVSFIFYLSLCITGLILAFSKGWKLALVCIIYFPVSLSVTSIVTSLTNKRVKDEVNAYASAGAIAEEVFSAIRTVVAFDGQKNELSRYEKFIRDARRNNIQRGFYNAINQFVVWFLVYGFYGLSFWYGIRLIIAEREKPIDEQVYTPETLITVFFGILNASYNFSQCSHFVQIFTSANAAALKIFQVIEEKPHINRSKGNGLRDCQLSGNIRFENVDFQYPARKNIDVLRNFNLDIKSGETVALVGNSGCGKSTCIQLIQRFYDPVSGNVLIDGRELKKYDLNWIRNQIGVVGQEPVLFATTIEENIKYGNLNASLEEVQEAAKIANAHNFITKLPNSYRTVIGERGAQLSGGQKQRIAIARALVRNPSILLLDEATSALDTESEASVQNALDNASKRCTTVIVAHRLSTIRGADRIVVIDRGVVVEDGNHEALMKSKGDYYKLVMAQTNKDDRDDANVDKKVFNDESICHVMETNELKLNRNKSLTMDDDIVAEDNTAVMGSFEILKNIILISRREWWVIIIACLGAITHAAGVPLHSIVLGNAIKVLANSDANFVRSEGDKSGIYFALIGVMTGASVFLHCYLFTISGEKLVKRIRTRTFETMMNQEIGWFDKAENGVGALCTKLSADASSIQGASGQLLGTVLNAVAGLGIVLIIAYFYDWRIALVNSCFVPLIFFSFYFETAMGNSGTLGSKIAVEKSSQCAVEAFGSIRTVSSLCIENIFHMKYLDYLAPHYARTLKNVHVRGALMGMSRSFLSFSEVAAIYYGATLIRDRDITDISIVFKISEMLTVGAWNVGIAFAFTSNIQKGFSSFQTLFQLLNRVPEIQNDTASAIPQVSNNSDVHYKNIKFSYPTRPDVEILRGLSMDVIHGKTVALVGPSGCGKSTIIQLLERFYDPSEGDLLINQDNIKRIKLSALRMHLGIVSQEPNLFDRTILENIAYGDNSRSVNREECIEAAKNANIHDFVTSLPLGYETRLGEKGTQLSGGQKQRVAIARALVRNPQILLLDEATSALDSESEKVVQEALDKARKGRTCITIAHRLKTIQEADLILVIDKGVVSEMGTHQELLEQSGIYKKLQSMQVGRS